MRYRSISDSLQQIRSVVWYFLSFYEHIIVKMGLVFSKILLVSDKILKTGG